MAGYFRGQSELRVLFLALRYLQQTSRDNKIVTCNNGMQNENYTLNNTYVVVRTQDLATIRKSYRVPRLVYICTSPTEFYDFFIGSFIYF